MSLQLPTPTEIGSALAHFTNYRVLSVQEHCYPYDVIPASVMFGLGFRETTLRNIVGGAIWKDGKWVFSDEDAGWLQISRKYESGFLAKCEGCPSGTWHPPAGADPWAHTADELGYVPRFTPALGYVKASLEESIRFAKEHGVPAQDRLRFAVAAHNCGDGGAIDGHRQGNVDLHTAHGDYSAYVLALRPMIHDWIVAHPHWVYHPA